MNLNKIFILGNLTRDPIIKALPSGQSVANFGVATNRVYYDKDKQKKEQTEFHNVVAFGRTAEIIQQYLKKGSMVLIEGRVQTRNWEDQSGNKHYMTEIITEKMQLGPRNAPFQKDNSNFSGSYQNQNKENKSEEDIPIIEEGKDEPSFSHSTEDSNTETEKKKENPIQKDDLESNEEEINLKDIPF
ncbi:MAG: single-stranded DNA-binding protein [Patescibacteria group bacterium]|nr:single-stranded DNA-binding protein [Patescibacteria group bacterium]